MADAVPTTIVAGTTVKFSRSFSDYSAANGWTYKFYLIGPSLLNVEGEVNGLGFNINIDANDTKDLEASSYRYIERVSKDSEVYEVGNGRISIQANLATAEAGDYRSFARKALEAIQAVLENRASKDQESFTIGGRALVRTPLDQLRDFEREYAERVRLEDAAGQIDFGRRIGIRFRHA